MSFDAVHTILRNQKQPRGAARWVLASLADFQNSKTSKCNPSIPSIAFGAGISGNYCIDVLKALEGAGHIKVTRKKRPGRSDVNDYEIILGCENPVVVPRRNKKKKGRTTQPFPGSETVNNANQKADIPVNNVNKMPPERVVPHKKKGRTTQPESVMNKECRESASLLEGGTGGAEQASKQQNHSLSQDLVSELTEKAKPPPQEISYGLGDRLWISSQEWNKLAKANPHLLGEYAKNRYPVVSIGGLVTKIGS